MLIGASQVLHEARRAAIRSPEACSSHPFIAVIAAGGRSPQQKPVISKQEDANEWRM